MRERSEPKMLRQASQDEPKDASEAIPGRDLSLLKKRF